MLITFASSPRSMRKPSSRDLFGEHNQPRAASSNRAQPATSLNAKSPRRGDAKNFPVFPALWRLGAFAFHQKLTLCKGSPVGYLAGVSATEILNALPKLTEAERRAVRQKLVELAAQNEDIALCDQAALEGAMMLDRMEEEDARRQRR